MITLFKTDDSQPYPYITKDANDILDYTLDFAVPDAGGKTWLNGDTIASVVWTASTGITVGTGAQAPTNTSTTATIWLSGGTAGFSYTIACKITTAAGRVHEQTFVVLVVQK